MSIEVNRGDVWLVELDPSVGAEIRKRRPCVVVQRDAANKRSPTTIVCPFIDAQGRGSSLRDALVNAPDGGLVKDSRSRCDQLRAVDRSRLVSRLGRLSAESMKEIDQRLKTILDL